MLLPLLQKHKPIPPVTIILFEGRCGAPRIGISKPTPGIGRHPSRGPQFHKLRQRVRYRTAALWAFAEAAPAGVYLPELYLPLVFRVSKSIVTCIAGFAPS